MNIGCNPEKDTLEGLLDRERLDGVVKMLREICNEKAEHLRVNWQDEALAGDWDRAARALNRFARHAAVVLVSF